METKINVAELLKDCPKGMELDSPIWDGVVFDHINMEDTYPIYIKKMGGQKEYLTENGCFDSDPGAKCVIFPKGKTTWEGFQGPFKDGDIIADNHKNIAIYKGKMWYNCNLTDYYCGYRNYDSMFLIKQQKDGHFGVIEEFHFATEEEKQKLFRAIKDNGYKWNSETKTLEKLDETKFKEGDVLSIKWYEGYDYWEKIVIFKKYSNKSIEGNAPYIEGYGNTFKNGKLALCKEVPYYSKTWTSELQPATEEEKQKLFDIIKTNGYKWNPDTKTLEELIIPKFKEGDRIILKDNPHNMPSIRIKKVTDVLYILDEGVFFINSTDEKYILKDNFDICDLKPFDKVLVRTKGFTPAWTIDFYDGYRPEKGGSFRPFAVSGGEYFQQCIPYEGNEHLLGTTNDCDKFYKNWEE